MLVLRTLAQLANSAADAVRDGVSDEADIDSAMRFGANYPFGPLAWARAFGLADAVEVLVRGQPLDLTPFSRGAVARFEVK